MLKRTVLVVEDNEINREMLTAILSSEYRVLEAENGQEALSLLEQYKEGISLVFLDIIMPVMDGYTFLSVMKANPAYAFIPVIVVTQSDEVSDEVAALSHGAADFVVKPYQPQIILHRAANIINLRETAAVVNQIKYDRLTKLYSKEFFCQRARKILLRNPDKEYDIVCSDIENFKLFNDVFGVQAGDRFLYGVAEALKQGVGSYGICGRFNGDQFVFLTGRDWVYKNEAFQKIRDEIAKLPRAGKVNVRWGVYSVSDRTVSVETMCDRAILAAGSIKGQYGKYLAQYDEELRRKLLRERLITDGMEAALEEGQFEVYLQPKYASGDESMAGAEALVRWRHPQWGLQSPGLFIPIFEKNGFITRLDQYIWQKVCGLLQKWDRKGYPAVSVSVNVSRADIYNADLLDMLTGMVHAYGIKPSRLHLEITESAYTENPGQLIETVRSLRERGFVIEMDDFGSGYSSLNMLTNLPIDVLKLDMQFIRNETAKPENQGILRFIIDIARWLKLSVVAEGVETKEQFERLKKIGCDYVQGYYFAKPMPAGEFEELIGEGKRV